MKIVDLKCPNCGSTLRKKEQDILICSSCHSEFLIDDETPDYITINHYHQTQQPYIKTSTRQSNKLLAVALSL